jgi:fermentation-respiration switch protein FrsA (DUF1100 family)
MMQANTASRQTRKKKGRRWLLAGVLIVILIINGAGLFVGNIIYKEASVLHSRLNAQYTGRLKRLMEFGKKEKQWQDIVIKSRFGYPLQGTYIPNPQATDKTLIFLHGFTESRLAGLNYLTIYINAGFNLLLVDSRAHGESGGDSVTWGNYEKYDLDQWVEWVRQRFPGGTIGVHGISMGAATALMHAELNEANKRVAFYIADSSYSDFETLLALQMEQRLHLPGTVLPKLLLQYANVVAYFNSHFTYYQASPVRAVRNVTTPILYIHGEADNLVPAYMSQELYNATKGPRQIYTFPHADHVSAIFNDWYRYGRVVQNFTHSIEQHS